MTARITLTDIWRREGRWPEVASWMNDERDRLRAAGVRRRVRNEEVWRRAEEMFPPLYAAYAALAAFPPPGVHDPAPDEFQNHWRLFCALTTGYWAWRGLPHRKQLPALLIYEVVTNAPSDESARLLVGALDDLSGALSDLRAVLTRAAESIQGDDQLAQICRVELAEHLDALWDLESLRPQIPTIRQQLSEIAARAVVQLADVGVS